MKFLRKIWLFLKDIFRKTLIKKVRAKDVSDNFTVITYKGQKINLRNEEVEMFNALARSDKRAMVMKFAKEEKRGHIKFVKINGKDVAVRNRDYERRIKK